MFTGEYVTGTVSESYLNNIALQRSDAAKRKCEKDATNLEIHNER